MSFNFIPSYTSEKPDVSMLPEFYEFARDLDTFQLIVKSNDFCFVSGNDAIKIWILKALNIQTSRYTHRAYSNDYGNEITKLFGKNYKNTILKSELKRLIEEALLVNPYITKISDFNFEKKNSSVAANFTVNTIYGEFNQNYEYITE